MSELKVGDVVRLTPEGSECSWLLRAGRISQNSVGVVSKVDALRLYVRWFECPDEKCGWAVRGSPPASDCFTVVKEPA